MTSTRRPRTHVVLGLERLLGRAARPPARRARRARLQPGDGRPLAAPRRRHRARPLRRPAHHALRAPARHPRRRAGQHDRDRARRGPADGPAGVFALQRDARAHRGHAEGRRRHRGRPAGRRLPHLHLRLHDGQLHARGARARQARDRLRPPQPDRRGGGGRQRPRARLRILRRPVPDPDAPRHDVGRAGPALQRGLRHRLRPRGGGDGGLDARHVDGRHRTRRGSCPRPTCRPSTPPPCSPAPSTSRGRRCRKAAAPRGRSSSWARPTSTPRTSGAAAQRPGPRRRLLPPHRLPADLPEARRQELRRRADPRPGPRRASSRSRRAWRW